MNPNKSLQFEKVYARELLRIAFGDLDSAKVLAGSSGRPENALFHAEQAVEKALKAVTCALGRPVPMTHDLGFLLGEFKDDLPPGQLALVDLTPYATIRRYEEGQIVLSKKEIETVLKMAKDVLNWADHKIKALLK